MVPAGLVVLLLFRLSQNVFALSLAHSDRSCDTAKAGLAWSDGNNSDITKFMGPQVSWCAQSISFIRLAVLILTRYYTWGPLGYVNNASALDFVPMLWGAKQIASFNETIEDSIRTLNITTVLGMNESTRISCPPSGTNFGVRQAARTQPGKSYPRSRSGHVETIP